MLSHFARLAGHVGHARARTLLVLGGLFIGLAFAAVVIWFDVSLRQAVVEDAVREMRNDAWMLAVQEDRLLETTDLVQVSLIEHMREAGIDSATTFEQFAVTPDMHRYLQERTEGFGHIAALLLLDRHGNLLNSSRAWPPPKVNEADRDYISQIASANAPATYISAPVRGKTTGRWTIYLSRRFESSDGQVVGFIASAITTSYFEGFFARLPLTGGGAIALFRRDGVLLARFPHVDGLIGKSFTDAGHFRRIRATPDDSTIDDHSALDGKRRLIVPHAMEHFPLIVTVSDTTDSIFAYWSRVTWMLAVTTGLLELVLGATIWLSVRHVRSYERLQAAEAARSRAEAELAIAEEHERAAQALRAQEHRFDTALHSMLQGLLMISHSGQLLVVNHRFYELFSMPPGSLVPGIGYMELTDLVVEFGNVSAEDIRGVRERRAELIARNERAVVTWELSDGRSFNVTHQPTEEGWLTTFEEVTDRRRAEAMMVHLAHHDGLTDLPNRVLFRAKLEEALAFARRGHNLALLCLDLDQFKEVNDTLGHPIGDALLQAAAQRLTDCTREIDTVARIGGDEFTIVQTAIEKPTEATGFANRLLDLMSTPFEVAGHQIVIGTSIGIALAPQDGLDPDQLLRCADMALYRAKQDGRGVYRLFQAEMDAQMQARRLLELDLRQALPSGQLEVFYQPQVDLRVGAMTAVEALLRWHHPQRGLVSPSQFIPLAEEIGLIVPIGEWVLREACRTVASWPGALRVAVNLSPAQFKCRNLVAAVERALHEAGLPPDRLELEITETVMLNDTDSTLATLTKLRSLGVRIAMDDFGTGYSSLSYLRRFPFDRVKIDQSFVRDIPSKSDCGAIVRAVASLSRELGMATTAEGVETREQLDLLMSAGCSEIQGYLFSPAVTGDAVAGVQLSIAAMLGQAVEPRLATAAE